MISNHANSPMRRPILERFMEKVMPEPNSGCWLWTGTMQGMGYGGFTLTAGNTITAHRLSWKLLRGPITNNLRVLHKCDVKLCVNPDHLFLGTQHDNMTDHANKGRHWLGSRTHCPRGHEFNEANTVYSIQSGTQWRRRRCRICRDVYYQQWLRKQKDKLP